MCDRRQCVCVSDRRLCVCACAWVHAWQRTMCVHACVTEDSVCVCTRVCVRQRTVCTCVRDRRLCGCMHVRVWQKTTCESLLPPSSMWDQRIKSGSSDLTVRAFFVKVFLQSKIDLFHSRMMAHTCTQEAKAGGSAQTQSQIHRWIHRKIHCFIH